MAITCKTLIQFSLSSFNRFRPRSKPLPRFSLSHLRLGIGFKPASVHSSAIPAPSESEDTVEELLGSGDYIYRLMKMERRSETDNGRWFPYLDAYKVESMAMELGSSEVIEALDPYIMEKRKERIRRAVENRSYSVCLVVEGLTDFGNVSAVFRSADALGIQSVHVIAVGSKKRCC